MVHFNLRKGFTFIETVIALAVIGIMTVSIFALQQAMLQSSISATNNVRRMYLLKNVLYDPSIQRENHDEERKTEQKIKMPPTTIKLTVEKSTNERLKEYNLEHIHAKALWEDFAGQQEESLLLLHFVMPKKEDRT